MKPLLMVILIAALSGCTTKKAEPEPGMFTYRRIFIGKTVQINNTTQGDK